MKKIFSLAISSLLLMQLTSGQNNWRPFAGVHISAAGGTYYIGPSFSAGVTHSFGKKKKWSWAPEVQYFRKYDEYPASATSHSWDRFVSFSARSNFNYKTGSNPNKGFIIGGGIGFQYAKDECATITQNGTIKEENMHYDAIKFGAMMVTFNSGYSFPLGKKKSLQALISVTGPQTAKDNLGTYVEAVSVISTGVRIVL